MGSETEKGNWGLLTCIIEHVTTLGNWGSLLLGNSGRRCRLQVYNLAEHGNHLGALKKYTCLSPTHRDLDLIGLGYGLGINKNFIFPR